MIRFSSRNRSPSFFFLKVCAFLSFLNLFLYSCFSLTTSPTFEIEVSPIRNCYKTDSIIDPLYWIVTQKKNGVGLSSSLATIAETIMGNNLPYWQEPTWNGFRCIVHIIECLSSPCLSIKVYGILSRLPEVHAMKVHTWQSPSPLP